MLLINGKPEQTPAIDRGLLYGDGVFETLRLVDGRAPLWSRHWRRLCRGMALLSMPYSAHLAHFIGQQLRQLQPCEMARVTVTRVNQGRGYAPMQAPIKVIVQGFAQAPATPVKRLQRIQHRLAEQPALVACKHLNRLDQVIAAAEIQRPFDDGIMLDQQGNVTCSTVGNVFLWDGHQLVTPLLDVAGIQGVMRDLVIDCANKLNLTLSVRRVSEQDMYNAQRVWVSNAVRGLTPVVQLQHQHYDTGPVLPPLFHLLEEVRYGRQVI